MKMARILCGIILMGMHSSVYAMEKTKETIYKEDDKACFSAIEDFKISFKEEWDFYRLELYADSVKAAVAFSHNMNNVSLGCELAKVKMHVPRFPLFIVMAKEKRCKVLLGIMLQRGANPNMCYAAQHKVARPLSEAIIYGAFDNAELLLQAGAKPVVEFKLRSDDPDKDPRLSLLMKYGATAEDIWGGPLSSTNYDPLGCFKNLPLS